MYLFSVHACYIAIACMHGSERVDRLKTLLYTTTMVHYNISLATNHDYRALCLGPLRIIDRPTMASATYEDGNGQ